MDYLQTPEQYIPDKDIYVRGIAIPVPTVIQYPEAIEYRTSYYPIIAIRCDNSRIKPVNIAFEQVVYVDPAIVLLRLHTHMETFIARLAEVDDWRDEES